MKKPTIDNLPVAVFQKVLTTGYLPALKEAGFEFSEKAWAAVFNEYVQAFGLSPDYLSYMRHLQRSVLLYSQAYSDNKRYLLTFADVEKAKAEAMIASIGSGRGFGFIVAQVSKAMGFRVNPNEVTVNEFYSYIKAIEDGNGKG